MTHHQGQWKSSDFGKSIFPDFFTYARQGPEMDELASWSCPHQTAQLAAG